MRVFGNSRGVITAQIGLFRLPVLQMLLVLLALFAVACNAETPRAPALTQEPTAAPDATDKPDREPTPTSETLGPITDIQVSSGNTYEEDVLTVGKLVYIDRDFTFTYVPPLLEGQEFIRTANDDKKADDDDFLTFTLTEDAIIYVLYDMRSIGLPEWLADAAWEMTDSFVATDDVIRRVHQKEFPAGEVTLGGNAQPPMTGPMSNYNVVVSSTDKTSSESNLSSRPEIKFAVDHVIYSEGMLGQYLEGGQLAPYVRPQDSFMLLSGNNDGDIDTELLNSWAAALRELYPDVTLYAATSGINNIRNGAADLDTGLFTGLMMVYEPNQDNAPEFSWDMAETELIWEEAAEIIDPTGLEAWGKPSGRSLPGRAYFGSWDYGVLATIMDGLNVQTQGSCRKDDLNKAMPNLIQQYRDAGVASDLFVQVTVASSHINYSDPEDAIYCAQSGWAYPEVDGVTLWWSPDSVDQAEEFLELRDEQFPAEPR
jgi:hypothetical protein